LQIFFATDGFHPIPFLRDRLYLEEIADAAREESERIGLCTPLLSRVGWHPSDIRLNDTSMSTPEAPDSTEHQGCPIPADEDSVDIDVADVEYEQTYAPGTTTATSFSRRPLELTDIEVSFKRGVTSALHHRLLFVLDKETNTPSDATAFQLQASRWNKNFSVKEVIVARAVDLVQICIFADNAFTMLPESDLPRWLDLLSVPQAAELVIKYFGPHPDSGRSLAENFGNVSFDFSFLDPAPERTTMMAYLNLVQTHEQLDGLLSVEQHGQLISLIERRLPPDGQLRTDYFMAKKGWKSVGFSDASSSSLHQRRSLCVDEEERELWRPLQGLPLPPRDSSPH
jgi:hypothetical protein